jgi:hypothetical protein
VTATGRPWPADADARARWREGHLDVPDRVLPPHPAPEVPCRAAYAHEVPTGARRLAELAASLGWMGQVTYARGYPMHASLGTALGIVDSVAVRLWGPDGQRAVGLWHNGKAEAGWVWVPGQIPRDVGVAAVKKWVVGDGG